MLKNILTIVLIFTLSFIKIQAQITDSHQYVLLGEPTHGDGAVFDEKVNLIKKLRQEKHFNTILFEAGFYDNFKAWELYQSNQDISAYNQSIFAIWSETKAFQELLSYVKQNPEMKILGVDCQEGTIFQQHYLNDLKDVFRRNNISFSETEFQLVDKTLIYQDLEYLKNNNIEIERMYSVYDQLLKALASIKDKDFKTKVIEQTFKSSKSEIDYTLKKLNGESFPVQNPRDQQMAENFTFLQKELENEKLILWAANYHIANNLSTFKLTDVSLEYLKKLHQQEKELNGHNEVTLEETIKNINELKEALPFGGILKKQYRDQLYSLAFTSHSGNYLGMHDKETRILQPPQNSLENDLFSKASPSVLIDLKTYSKDEFYTSTLGYLPISLNWKNVYDGIYYIPKMYVPEMISYRKPNENNVQIKESNRIKGRILDGETKKPIAYADIYFKSNNKSVVANEMGEFTISKSSSVNDYLIISAVGYQNDSIGVESLKFQNNIYLKLSTEKTTQIEEIVLKSQKALSATEILEKAKNNVEHNYIQTPYNQRFYVSDKRYNEKNILKYSEEALVEIFNKDGLNSSNNVEKNISGEILQYKSHTENSERSKESGIGSLWVQLNRDIILSKANVLYRTSSYSLTSKKVIEYNGKNAYQIDFINNSPGVYSTGYGYPAPEASSGTIYIDTETFAVIRYEHCIARKMHQYKNSKYPSQTFHQIIQTYKEVDGKYFLNFYKQIDKENYTKDSQVIATFYGNFYLMSEDITTNQVTKYDRPIIKLKEHFSQKINNVFWDNANFYIEDENYRFENCNFK